MHTHHSHQKGLTLLELIVVIVVLAILSAIAIPTFSSMIHRSKVAALEATAHLLANDAAALAATALKGPAALDTTATSSCTTTTYVCAVKTEVLAIKTGKITVKEKSPEVYTLEETGISVCLTVSATYSVQSTVSAGACTSSS